MKSFNKFINLPFPKKIRHVSLPSLVVVIILISTYINGYSFIYGLGYKKHTIILHVKSQSTSPKQPYTGALASLASIPELRVREANCKALIEGGTYSENLTMLNPEHWHPTDEQVGNAAKNCSSYIKSKHYILRPISVLEANFPLAYSIVMYKSVHQVEQLLQAIYRPQNYYCIHVDLKASISVFQSMKSIADCFDNVFLSSKRIDVRWGQYTVLEPDLRCMEDLLSRKYWKYFINLTGQEFPLHTNEDIVRFLTALNGYNAVPFNVKFNSVVEHRTKYRHNGLKRTKFLKDPPPHNMRLMKSAVHVAVTRGFVNFSFNHQVGRDFIEWIKDTGHPSEHFFNSLNVNPQLGVPGAFTGDFNEPSIHHNPYIRFKHWYKCKKGTIKRHAICMLGLPYLADMANSPYMFANKFLPDFQPLARMCLEELLYNRTREQFLGRQKLNLKPYQLMSYMTQHNPA